MAVVLPIPPQGTPYIDPTTGEVALVWRNYFLALDAALSFDVAPRDAPYWVSESNTELTAERNIGALASGYLKITTAIGIATPSTVTTIPTTDLTGILGVTKGGTGSNLSASGGVAQVVRQSSLGGVFSVSQLTAAEIANAAALTKTDDANVTVTLGGTPTTALLAATSLTLGWTGLLGVARGGTAADNTTQTYTPTLTNVANLAASTAYQCQYMRVGSVVTVSGRVDVDPTAGATSTQLGISLPIASNFSAPEDCGGTACCPTVAGNVAAIMADATNNRAQMQWLSGTVANDSWWFSFTYRLI